MIGQWEGVVEREKSLQTTDNTGADQWGGGGSWGSGPSPFGGPPNFIKREKNVASVRAKMPRFST